MRVGIKTAIQTIFYSTIAVRKPKVSHYLIGFPTIKSSLL